LAKAMSDKCIYCPPPCVMESLIVFIIIALLLSKVPLNIHGISVINYVCRYLMEAVGIMHDDALSSDDDDMLKCANCGKDGDGLKLCNACKEVRYCSVACQKNHRPKHKKHCKKRAAELHDEALFREPPPKEDCPICFLPLPRQTQTSYLTCCGKNLCHGCVYAAYAVSHACPFCREQRPSKTEVHKLMEGRMEANDPLAWQARGTDYSIGDARFPQDKKKAIKFWSRAAELGSIEARFSLGHAFITGEGVEADTKKAKYHLEIAAIGGSDIARTGLAHIEARARNYDRAAKHFMIAASRGREEALTMVRKQYSIGQCTKEEFEKTLRAYKVSVDEMKSENRDKAAADPSYFNH